jgi:hypothetical protein
MAFDPYDTHLWGAGLGVVPVSYPRKNINTMALLATTENIGALSIEFDAELRYYGDSGMPYFTFWAKRNGTEQDPTEWEQELLIKPGVWIVVLKDEFRTFRQNEFEHTFTVDHVITPETEMTEYARKDAQAAADLFNKETTRKSDEQLEALRQKLNDSYPTIVETSMVGPGVSPVGEKTEIIAQAGELDTDEANE